ncbi:uncharacterized protein LOC122252419 isoform X2 [Penaeus japonicus]|uniref:uncharacterized protein LOC122252419 isoform X2 n=1 Tax=Penaeus japonicus TaxID=27405 RepID=UPI001C71259F|nr:uncharacterized protein LOC122252419 isoform X2 [Penaeus japonicus]
MKTNCSTYTMAKGFIDTPLEGNSITRPSNLNTGEIRQPPVVAQPGGDTHTGGAEDTGDGQRSPSSSTTEENVVSAVSSPPPDSVSFSPASASSGSPGPEHQAGHHFSLPTLPPYRENANRSVEELNELALQDSENNNVDENSNDQQYDQYTNYHQEYGRHQFVPDQSVRPRTRMSQPSVDEHDHAPYNYEYAIRRRSGSFSHRRNQSEDLSLSSASFDSGLTYPQLPNINSASGYSQPDRLPRLPSQQDQWIEQRHPPRCAPTGAHDTARGWFPLSLRGGGYGPQPPPTQENVRQEAQELLLNFTSDALQRNHLPVPENDIIRKGFSNPAWLKAGQELRMLADAFADTEERRRVRCMAESVNMASINMENFFQLCGELFCGGITRERIVALFTFVGDVAVHQVRHRGEQFLSVLLKWSFRYLVDNICKWVQEAGGWGVVLNQGMNILYKTVVFMCCLVGTVAGGVYIWKTLKDM